MLERAAVLALLVALTTCCPTLWLQVHKGDPAAWPTVKLAPVANPPLQAPTDVPNRFDVLESGRRTVFEPEFADTFELGGNGDVIGAKVDALDALTTILNTVGAKPLQQDCTTFIATVVCEVEGGTGPSARCTSLNVASTASIVKSLTGIDSDNPAVVRIGRQLRLVREIDSLEATDEYSLALATPLDATDNTPVTACLSRTFKPSTTLLSFIHMSDIQLRDPSVTLTDQLVSARLDWFEPLSSFEYDQDMAFYNEYLAEAVVATIDELAHYGPVPDRPTFVVHTGDSIDSGSLSELKRFHEMIHRLSIPFFELFGNHDVLVFGNLTPTSTHETDSACSPIASLLGGETRWAPNKLCVDQLVACPNCVGHEAELVAKDKQADSRALFMSTLQHTDADTVAEPEHANGPGYCADTHPTVRADSYSRAHGFDLGTADDRFSGKMLGYYAFVQKLATDDGVPRSAVFIGLDSEELPDHVGGTRGRIEHDQLTWLKSVLDCVQRHHPRDLVFVLAHQPLGEIDVEPKDASPHDPYVLASLLESHPNIVAFLYGHHHQNQICGDPRPGTCAHFWEVETASLIEFPQEGRLMRIKQIGDNLAFLELTMLRERLASDDNDLAKYVALARRGAERDYCHTHPDQQPPCSVDQRPYRTDGRDTNARLFFRMP
jgi:hypothetical protein